MIVKVEIEAGPELKKLLEKLLGNAGKPEKSEEPLEKKVIEHCAKIKEKIVVPTSLIKKEKPSLILQKQSPEKRAEIKAKGMELLKDNTPMEAWRKLSKEYPEIYINDGNLYHWGKGLKEEDEPEEPKEEPESEEPEPAEKEPRTKYIKGHPRAPEIQERAVELFKEDSKPSKICEILKEEFNIDINDSSVYRWKDIFLGEKAGRLYGFNAEKEDRPPKEKFRNLGEKQSAFKNAVIEGNHSREGISAYLKEHGYDVEPAAAGMFIYHNMRAILDTVKEKEKKEGKDRVNRYYLLDQAPKEEPPPEESEPTFKSKINISKLKHVEITTDDLMIIDDIVMCPKANMGVDATNCKSSCTSGYIAMVKCIESGIPYVRCTKAGSA